MLRTAVLVGIISTLCFGLSGCGQKGDLYMPDRAPVSMLFNTPSGL